jgi:hypothetical protein
MGYRDDYIDLMAGVPQIAADLLQRPTSAALGHIRTSSHRRRSVPHKTKPLRVSGVLNNLSDFFSAPVGNQRPVYASILPSSSIVYRLAITKTAHGLPRVVT